MNLNISNQYPKLIEVIGDQAEFPACIHPLITTEARGLQGRVILEIATGNLNIVFFSLWWNRSKQERNRIG